MDEYAWSLCQSDDLGKPLRPFMGISMDPAGTRVSAAIAWQLDNGDMALRMLLEATGNPIQNVEQLGHDLRLVLGAVPSGRASLGQAVTRFEAGGFDVLAGKSGSGALADLSQARFDALRQEMWLAARGYDHVVVDLSAGVEGHVRRLIPRAATTMVVLTDEPTSLTDA